MVEGATNMTRVGRKPQGWKLIERLSAEESSKARLKAFLQTMTGQCTVDEACRELGIEKSRFFVLRNTWLEQAAHLLDPKSAGRPRKTAAETETESPEVRQLKQHLLAAELRARLAQAKTTSTPRERKKGARR
jgi:hypothetical protein